MDEGRLQTDRAKFKSEIDKQIQKGKALLRHRVDNHDQLERLRGDHLIWHQYVAEVLLCAFTVTRFHDEFARAYRNR